MVFLTFGLKDPFWKTDSMFFLNEKHACTEVKILKGSGKWIEQGFSFRQATTILG